MIRGQYWACSEFANKLRGTPKLKAGTTEEWRAWRKTAKKAHPFRYWLAEEFIGKVQDFVNAPADFIHSIKYYIDNRFITKSHCLSANKSHVKPGSWCDLSNRIIYCLFDELVNFVEVESAWAHIVWMDKEERKKYPLNATGYFRNRAWRCPEAGIEHYTWASKLIFDESYGFDKDNPEYGKPTQQAEKAIEILALYNWWKNIRPTRLDPHDASGWTAFCEAKRILRKKEEDEDDFDILGLDETPEQKAFSRKALDECGRIEKEQEDEDTEMLIRLIKVRNGLWT